MALTKKELFIAVSELVKKYGIEEEPAKKLLALVEPKKGGAKLDINDIACFDEDGTATHIYDSILKLWVPVFDETGEPNFYEKPDTELGWSRFSRVAEKARKTAEKTYKATKDAILNDLLEGAIDQDEAKAAMEAADNARHDYELPEDFSATAERPCE